MASRTATLNVKLGDLPQVREAIRALANERDDLRDLLQAWEPRVTCPQCGQRYSHRACGPTHAVIARMVKGS